MGKKKPSIQVNMTLIPFDISLTANEKQLSENSQGLRMKN
jgi:hypothetical protein